MALPDPCKRESCTVSLREQLKVGQSLRGQMCTTEKGKEHCTETKGEAGKIQISQTHLVG